MGKPTYIQPPYIPSGQNSRVFTDIYNRLNNMYDNQNRISVHLSNQYNHLNTNKIPTIVKYLNDPSTIPSSFSFFEGIVTNEIWSSSVAAIEGWFNIVTANTFFVDKMIANNIFANAGAINQLFAQNINVTGSIKSDNYLEDTSGFKIDGISGDAEFNNVVARGEFIGILESQEFTVANSKIKSGSKLQIRTLDDLAFQDFHGRDATLRNLELSGTINYINETNLQVEDKTITLNKNGTNTSAVGGGIIIERPGGNRSLLWQDDYWDVGSTPFAVGNASASTHAVNRATGDGRYGRLAASNTWGSLNVFNSRTDLNVSGEDAEVLRLNINRSWSFFQRSSGGTTRLALKSDVISKMFDIEDSDGNYVARFRAYTDGTRGLRLDGNYQVGTAVVINSDREGFFSKGVFENSSYGEALHVIRTGLQGSTIRYFNDGGSNQLGTAGFEADGRFGIRFGDESVPSEDFSILPGGTIQIGGSTAINSDRDYFGRDGTFTGNVGIGGSIGSDPLTVFGNVMFRSTPSANEVGRVRHNGSALNIQTSQFTGGVPTPITFTIGANEAMRIGTSRNVGIGTTEQDSKVHISHSDDILTLQIEGHSRWKFGRRPGSSGTDSRSLFLTQYTGTDDGRFDVDATMRVERNLFVEGGLFAKEFTVEQEMLVLGRFMSPYGNKIEAVSGSSGSETITVAERQGLRVNDIIHIQQVTGGTDINMIDVMGWQSRVWDNTTGWSTGQGATLATTDEDSMFGGRSALCSVTDDASSARSRVETPSGSSGIPSQGSVPITFSVWLKRKSGGTNLQLTIVTWSDSGGNLQFSGNNIEITNEWVLYTHTVTAHSDTETIHLRVRSNGQAVEFYMDNPLLTINGNTERVKSLRRRVASINNREATLTTSGINWTTNADAGDIEVGDDFVVRGNTTDPYRDDLIEFRVADVVSPTISFWDNIDDVNKGDEIMRMGWLGDYDSIFDPDEIGHAGKVNNDTVFAITNKQGMIAGWDITPEFIRKQWDGGDSYMTLSTITDSFWESEGFSLYFNNAISNSGGLKSVRIGRLNNFDGANDNFSHQRYGIQVRLHGGSEDLFYIGSAGTQSNMIARIAGWNFDYEKLYGGNTIGEYTGMQSGGGTTRVFFAGATSTNGDGAKFFARADGRIFHDSLGSILYNRSRVAGFGINNTAAALNQDWTQRASVVGASNSLTSSSVKVNLKYRHRFGINRIILTGRISRVSIEGNIAGTASAEVELNIPSEVSNSFERTAAGGENFTLELDVSSLSNNQFYDLQVILKANVVSTSGAGSTTQTTLEANLDEDILLHTAT